MTGTMDAAPKVVVKGGVVPYLLVGGAMQAVELYRTTPNWPSPIRPTSRAGRCTRTSTSTAVR